jgi:hypothetical protein
LAEEKLDFKRRLLVLGNLGLLAWIFLAFLGVLLYNFLYGWLYLFFSAFIVYLILRRLGCSSCYRCKTCTSGFGRLAGVFFGRGFVKKESAGNMLGFVVFIYFLLLLLPTVMLSISLLDAFSYVKVLTLACLLALAVYSLSTWFHCSTAKKKS